MGFQKGHPNYLKNHSEETKQKMSLHAKQTGRRPVQPKGYKHSAETLAKMSQARLKNPNRYWLGKDRSDMFTTEYREKMSGVAKSRVAKGLHNFWKGGVTSLNQTIRKSLKYKLWREKVFKRDNWTCQKCLTRGGKIYAHHIKAFSTYPKLRFRLSNGQTLCKGCHTATDNYGRRALFPQPQL